MTAESLFSNTKYLKSDTTNNFDLLFPINWLKNFFVTQDDEQEVTKSATGINFYSVNRIVSKPESATVFVTKQKTDIYPISFDSVTSADVDHQYVIPGIVKTKTDFIFLLGKNVNFEDGISNEFTNELKSMIIQHGRVAIKAIEDKIATQEISAEVIFEALTLLGRVKHIATHTDRLNVLISNLFHSSPQVRDGAGLGIASMDDSSVIPYLEMAIRNECVPDLKADLRLVLQQLEERE